MHSAPTAQRPDTTWGGQPANLSAWGATVRGTYRTPDVGYAYVPSMYAGPWGQAALRLQYVSNAGGRYA